MRRNVLFFLLLCLCLPGALMAQGITTASLNGTVIGGADVKKVPVPGALVQAVHEPTGTVFKAMSREDGRYNLPAVRVGGPYTITVSCEGFRAQEIKDIYLKLGEDRLVDFALVLETIDAGAVVVTESNPIISSSREGTSQNVGEDIITNMPSIARSLDDFTRMAPQFDSDREKPGAFNVGGRSSRYNNIQIDGAQNNDLFGLGNSGTPGGQTYTTPISLDAVQEFQIVMSPYDVRQGGFTGGGVNVITRSGTNTFHGSGFFFGRNQDLVGKGIPGTKFPKFNEYQFGARVGGPIIKDKLFFFANFEITRKTTPTDLTLDDSGSSSDFGGATITKADADRFISILKTKYGYDPGPYGYYDRKTNSNKIFARVDWNINPSNRMTVRYNWVDSLNDILWQSTTQFKFSDNMYHIKNKTNSAVFQLNSTIKDNLFNELTVAYSRIRDRRAGDTRFPQVTAYIRGSYQFRAGTEQYSTQNELDQDVVEVTDNLTFFKGNHTFTVGTHNEFFKFRNLFISNNFGVYSFNSLDLFEAGKPYNYNYIYSNTGDPHQAVRFSVQQLGFYAGDTWAVFPNVRLTMGVRFDVPRISDKPTYNPNVEAKFGYRTDEVPSGHWLVSPRVGFNWDVNNDRVTQVRGGVGMFSGRTPYVWLSNQFAATGIEFTRLVITKNVPDFVADPDNQPRNFSASTNEIDLCDPDYKYPQVFRTNLAIDRQLPWGIVGTIEYIYTKNVNEILYRELNVRRTGATLLSDGRPLWGTVSGSNWNPNYFAPEYNYVPYLTNTSAGSSHMLSFQAQKQFDNGFTANAYYTYGQSKDRNSGSSSQAISNWRYNYVPGDPNNPPLTWSDYDVRHRIVLAGSYTKQFFFDWPTTFSLFYSGRSGRPYTTGYSNDVNGDGTANDTIYVPRDASDIILTTNNWFQLNNYILGDPALDEARGTILSRNASREPWYHSVDFRLMQDFNIPGLKGNKIEFTWDILNLMNIFHKDWGVMRYIDFQDTPLRFMGMDAATGKPKYAFSYRADRFLRNELLSRWQMQFGVRYLF